MSRIRLVPVVARPPAYMDMLVTPCIFPIVGELYLLDEVGHGECLVKKPEFTALVLPVVGVTKNTTIQQRSVNISHHGPDIPSRIWRLARRRELNRVEIVDHRWVEVDRISFVEGVNLSPRRDLDLHANQRTSVGPREARQAVSLVTHVRMCEDKFTKTGVECVSIHTVPC